MPDIVIQTLSERFVSNNEPHWNELSQLLSEAKLPRKKRNTEKLLQLPGLYRRVASDLSEAKARGLSHTVINYLNKLVSEAYEIIYKNAQRHGGIRNILSAKRLFSDYLGHPWIVLIACLLFFGTGIISGISVYHNPDWGRAMVGADNAEMFISMYKDPIAGGENSRSASEVAQGVSFYIQNNVTISFLCFAGGILLGVGSLFFLVYNGLFIGSIAGLIIQAGYAENFWTFVIAHSAFELTGIVLCGASGLYLGSLIIKAGGIEGRAGALREARSSLVRMVLSAALLVFCAAFIESGISGQPVTLVPRIIIASACFVLIILLFVVLPLVQGKKHDKS